MIIIGSYKFYEAYLLYQGILYKIEGWDEDYLGDCWYNHKIQDGLVYTNIPLIISNKIQEKNLIELASITKDFKDMVRVLATKKVISYVDGELAGKILYDMEVCAELHFYDKNIANKIETICFILRINKEKSNLFNDKEIRVICPEFILFDDNNKYDVVFIDDINNMSLLLDGTVKLNFKNGIEIIGKTSTKECEMYNRLLIKYF